MPEQISQNLNQAEMAKITSRETRVPKPVELTPEEDSVLLDVLRKAKEAERTGNKSEAIKLYQVYQDQYEAIRTQRALEKRGEREVSAEVLEQSQKVYDFIFGEGVYNLQELYDKGEIIGLDKSQQEAIESEKDETQKYGLELVMSGGIPRADFLQAFKEKYASEFSTEGVYYWDQAQKDINQTEATLNPDRPTSFYTVALKPQGEVNDAHLETMNKTPEQAEAILQQKQAENPDLNLKGLILPEYLLLDAHHFLDTGKHLDEKHWSYLLGEKVTGTERALSAGWRSGSRWVGVSSPSGADSADGSRFAAVSACLKANLES